MKRGFKAAARRLALEVRREVGLNAFARFDPYALADEYGIPVYEVGDLGKEDQAREAADHYTASNSGAFSAALVPVGSGVFILDNDGHSMAPSPKQRQPRDVSCRSGARVRYSSSDGRGMPVH